MDKLLPSVVIPMHYKRDSIHLDLEKADAFLDYFDEEDVVYLKKDEIEFDRADFDDEYNTKVYIFED